MTLTATATTGLFDTLTDDELQALMDALVSRSDNRTGVRFSSNRMAQMLANIPGADQAYHTYTDIAREVGQLHSQVCDLFIGRKGYTGA